MAGLFLFFNVHNIPNEVYPGREVIKVSWNWIIQEKPKGLISIGFFFT